MYFVILLSYVRNTGLGDASFHSWKDLVSYLRDYPIDYGFVTCDYGLISSFSFEVENDLTWDPELEDYI